MKSHFMEYNFTVMRHNFVKLPQCDFIPMSNGQIIYGNETMGRGGRISWFLAPFAVIISSTTGCY